ncbi:hypothetical protein BH24GEM1_BH24GEM1_20210 [soil metagenome]
MLSPLDELSRDDEIGKQLERQYSPEVTTALAAVRRAAQENLNDGLGGIGREEFCLTAGCLALEGYRAPEAAWLYVKISELNARRLLHGYENPEIRNLLDALAGFFRAHCYSPELMHSRVKSRPDRAETA